MRPNTIAGQRLRWHIGRRDQAALLGQEKPACGSLDAIFPKGAKRFHRPEISGYSTSYFVQAYGTGSIAKQIVLRALRTV